jgi:hypothetical protein
MNTQAGDFYLSNEDADRIAASAGLSATEYDALAKAASLEQQQRNQTAVQRDIDKKMQILANLNAASRGGVASSGDTNPPPSFVPSGMSPVSQQAPVSASERFRYANQARSLQQEIQRNLSEAGMIQGPAITGPLTPTPPVGSEKPKPEALAQPSANAPAPEKPQYDPFAEFNNYEKTRKKFFSIAFKYVSQVPIQYQDEALKLVKEEWDNTGPSLPKSTLLPLKHPATGEILKDQALTADGRIVELPKTSQEVEEDGRSVIGYEGKAPTQGEAVEFRRKTSMINSGLNDLDELIELGKKGSSLSPQDRSRASNLATIVSGKFRKQIIGEGAVTDQDRRILDQIVPNPLQVFTLVNIPALLTDMKRRLQSSVDSDAAILGLKPTGQSSQPSQGGGDGGKSYVFDPSRKKVVPK